MTTLLTRALSIAPPSAHPVVNRVPPDTLEKLGAGRQLKGAVG